MLDDLVDLEYNPNSDVIKYQGPYPVIEINKVRTQVINDLKKNSKTKIEFDIKRKCAIFTQDLIDFMLNDKKPKDFQENFSYADKSSNPYLHRILDIDQDDLALPSEEQSMSDNTLSVDKTPSVSSTSDVSLKNSSQLSEIKSSNTSSITITTHSPISQQLSSSNSDELLRISRDLGLAHGCDKNCLRNLPSKDLIDNKESENITFICDFCQINIGCKTKMIEHLTNETHGSASEYILEQKSGDSGLDSSNLDHYFESNFNSKRKPKFIKNRACLKNFSSLKNFNKFEVFCPKCESNFAQRVLAASLHFKILHSTTMEDELYTIGELNRIEKFEIDKNHNCFTCKVRFKKLTDLSQHYTNTHHFPGNRQNETNLFICPFDLCSFRSTKYFTFRNHIIGHPFFNMQNENIKHLSVEVKVGIYKNANAYYHLPKNKEQSKTDKLNEIEAINDLNELNRPEDTKSQVRLKERKSFLEQNLA